RADLAARARFEGRDRPVEGVGCRAEALERWCGHAVPDGRVYIGIRSVHTQVASRVAPARSDKDTGDDALHRIRDGTAVRFCEGRPLLAAGGGGEQREYAG